MATAERALGRAGLGRTRKETALRGATRKKIAQAVGTKAEALTKAMLRVPPEQEVVEVSAKAEVAQSPLSQIDRFLSGLKKYPVLVMEGRRELRVIQPLIKEEPSENKVPATNPKKGAMTIVLFKGSSKIVDRIADSVRRNGIASGEWSKKDEKGIARIGTNVDGMEFEVEDLTFDSKKNPITKNFNVSLNKEAVAVEALDKSPILPDLEPPPDSELAKK